MNIGRRYAVLIGSSRFDKEPNLSPLRCPENDVDGMREVLAAEDLGAFEEPSVFKNADSSTVMHRIEETLTKATGADQVLIYYSGHGKTDLPGRLYLAMADTEVKKLVTTSIPIETLRLLIELSLCRKIMLILDCCFAGAVGRSFTNTKGSVDEKLQELARGNGVYILTASTASQTAQEQEGDDYGLLTKHIISGIKQGAAANNRGQVSMDDLYRYVYAKVTSEGYQEPMRWALNVRGEDLIIARASGVSIREQQQLLTDKIIEIRSLLPRRIFTKAIQVIEDRYGPLYELVLKLHREKWEVGRFIEEWDQVEVGEQRQPPASPQTSERQEEAPIGVRPSLEATTATILNRIRLTEADESIEKGASGKTDLKEVDIELKPDEAGAIWHRGEDIDRVITDYNRAIELRPDDAAAYYDRAGAYSDKGDTDRAIADYNRVIELDPDWVGAYQDRGNAYFDKGDYDRAITDYNRAIELMPDDALAYSLRGLAYEAKGDKDRAIAEYNRAIELKPDDYLTYQDRGNAYFDKGDYDRAITDYNRAIELMPDYAAAYYDRGRAYSAKGDKNRAIADFRKSLELFTHPRAREDALRELRGLGRFIEEWDQVEASEQLQPPASAQTQERQEEAPKAEVVRRASQPEAQSHKTQSGASAPQPLPPPPTFQERWDALKDWRSSFGLLKPAAHELPASFTENLKGVELTMILVPGGRFKMGSPDAPDEGPEHEVAVPGFYIGKYQVTQAQWEAVMGSNPSDFKGDRNLPVECVSWDDAKEFCKKLSQMTDNPYRLPSEVEWEYACRAGTTGDYAGNLDEMAWYDGNSDRKTHPVGGKQPNAFGLYDMHGNVWEWCEDVWHDDYKGAPSDGTAWLSGGNPTRRVLRGGSWYFIGRSCRSAHRSSTGAGHRDSSRGFRVVVAARTG